MKFYFLVLILLLIPFTTAVEFSPTSLEFNLEKNQQVCKDIFVNLDSQATVSDVWAQNQNDPWSVTQFQTSAQSNLLNLDYQTQIVKEQNQMEICLSGQQAGNYRGALVFRQSQQGNSIVQFVIWLKISISGNNQETPQTPTENKPSKKSHSSGSSSGGISEYVVVDNSKSKEELQQLSFNEPEEKIKLNSRPSKNKEEEISSFVPSIIIIMMAFLITLLFLLLRKN